jgi:hypothetical protein
LSLEEALYEVGAHPEADGKLHSGDGKPIRFVYRRCGGSDRSADRGEVPRAEESEEKYTVISIDVWEDAQPWYRGFLAR